MTGQPAIARLPDAADVSAARTGVTPFTRRAWFFVLASLLILAPCYWQPRLQGGDLSSHMHNAWLTELVESGRGQGLLIVSQTTNVLFDLMLDGLFRVAGPEVAQRVAVSIAVLIFTWGSFAFVSVVSGNRSWHLLACIAMLAYGWVFHMGFFNFYLSLGFCFSSLALLWNPNRNRILAAIPLFVLAYMAHALPLVWTVFLLAFVYFGRRVSNRGRGILTLSWLLAFVAFHIAIGRALVTRWSLQQLAMSTGLDQVWVFDGKYYLILVGLLLLWGLLFLDVMHRFGARRIVTGIPFQICLISAMGVFILPGAVLLPGYHHALVYIAERMSLGVGVCVCALLGMAQPRAWVRYGALVVAILFFSFLFRDERALNSFEDRMQNTVGSIEVDNVESHS